MPGAPGAPGRAAAAAASSGFTPRCPVWIWQTPEVDSGQAYEGFKGGRMLEITLMTCSRLWQGLPFLKDRRAGAS